LQNVDLVALREFFNSLDLIHPDDTPFKLGWNAFITNDRCRFRPKSFYQREWQRGWNCAYLKNQERLCA
jgi:hypothetical protein